MDSGLLMLVALFAGFYGAVVGVGGATILIPALTLLFKVDIRYAIAASLLSVVATSSVSASHFLKKEIANLRLAVLLETGTVVGALLGFYISTRIHSSTLFILFAGFLLLSSFVMLRAKSASLATSNHPWSVRLAMSTYYQGPQGERVDYMIESLPFAVMMMFFSGVAAALLGAGAILAILIMDLVVKLPFKVSAATSSIMTGVAAAAASAAFVVHGDVRPEIVAPVTIGIIAGSYLGARAMVKMPVALLRKVFVVALILLSIRMGARGFGL